MSLTADRLAPAGLSSVSAARATGVVAARLETRIVSGAEWDQAISDFDAVCQEQMHTFAAARWPSVEQEPMLFLQNGEMVGGALVMLQGLPLNLGKIAVAKWAPMLRDVSRVDAAAIQAGMVEAMIADYADRRGYMLSVLPRASITDTNHDYEQLIARGFKKGSVLGFPNRYIVNLRLSDEEQRKSFSQTWRRQLNKSEKAGLTFEHVPAEAVGDFDVLYNAMTDRKQFTDHSAYETVPALMGIQVAALRPEVFYVRHEGVLVGGALIFKAGDRAVYLYGATNDQALPLRAGYFMHWHIIRWLRDNTRATWYDLGGTDGFQGLHQFKTGMVGTRGVIQPVPPVANYGSKPLAYLVGTGAFWARDTYHRLRRAIDGLVNPKKRPTQARPGEASE
ncbi:Acetyltransferase (GNAT) domain-containing protein [Devosia sp. YR412]|uniref:lipid II:glycine glycyltransferase FemX n=1 Tax=Devosia sp. YR412 TaxID=1881030 RepID=UPI0008D1D66E|nr:GNAT family N-acetyltransferase [Devosia sp. YR412]SEP99723.1 Acetyltransferase (GNAT) domain-containing protein [Devosia sp. YR412]